MGLSKAGRPSLVSGSAGPPHAEPDTAATLAARASGESGGDPFLPPRPLPIPPPRPMAREREERAGGRRWFSQT